MGKINSYAVVFISSLAWSAAMVIGGTLVETTGRFTTLTLGLLMVAALILPLGLKKVKDLMNDDLFQTGALLGLLMGALGMGGLLSALQFVSPLWVLGAILGSPLLSAVIGQRKVVGVKMLAVVGGYMGLVTMTSGTELLSPQFSGLLLCGLGMVSLGLGLSHYRMKGQNLSRVGLIFWGAVSGAIFLCPAALIEPVRIADWSTGQFAASAGLALAMTLGLAGWAWLGGADKTTEDNPLTLAVTPILGLIFLMLSLGLEVGAGEVMGMVILSLALWISGKHQARATSHTTRPIEFAPQYVERVDGRRAA